MFLDRTENPEDIKKLNTTQLTALSEEVRDFLIETVSKTGGHLASNLGVVELTLALLKVFDFKRDKIVFDVGHQCYVYKMFTGRKSKMDTLRSFGGISGFPRTKESEFDFFDTGHAGTSVSAAFAFAQANRIDGKDDFAIAVIGDASLSNGLSMEAMNNAGRSKANLIVILNDNNMSINKNVGNMSKYLTKIRTTPGYGLAKDKVKNTLSKLPGGKVISNVIASAKYGIKHLVLPTTMFDDFGFSYVGPVDGHDIKTLTAVLERAKKMKQPVFIHTVTSKGKGYSYAEDMPNLYHGVSNFNKKEPISDSLSKESYSYIAGDAVLKNAKENKNVVAICAAMADATGLIPFSKELPERFFDVGISEGHAVTFAGGLSESGKVPVVFIYSTFLQRAYDNIVHDVALTNRHVVFMIDRAGISGNDGETHQGIFDISFLSHIPNLKIFTPNTDEELKAAVYAAINKENCPVAIRYPKGNVPKGEKVSDIYSAVKLREGNNVTVVSVSHMTEVVKKADFDGDHFHLNSIIPIDIDKIAESVKKTQKLVTVEDSLKKGGMGEILLTELVKRGIYIKTEIIGVDEFVEHGSVDELLKKYNMDEKSLSDKLK